MEKKIKFTYWVEPDGMYLGYLMDYPEHWTQGVTLDDLKEQLIDLFKIFSDEIIPGIKKTDELIVV